MTASSKEFERDQQEVVPPPLPSDRKTEQGLSVHLLIEGTPRGPYTLEQVQDKVKSEGLLMSTRVSDDGGKSWCKLYQFGPFKQDYRPQGALPMASPQEGPGASTYRPRDKHDKKIEQNLLNLVDLSRDEKKEQPPSFDQVDQDQVAEQGPYAVVLKVAAIVVVATLLSVAFYHLNLPGPASLSTQQQDQKRGRQDKAAKAVARGSEKVHLVSPVVPAKRPIRRPARKKNADPPPPPPGLREVKKRAITTTPITRKTRPVLRDTYPGQDFGQGHGEEEVNDLVDQDPYNDFDEIHQEQDFEQKDFPLERLNERDPHGEYDTELSDELGEIQEDEDQIFDDHELERIDGEDFPVE